jgi:hypothetical protein
MNITIHGETTAGALSPGDMILDVPDGEVDEAMAKLPVAYRVDEIRDTLEDRVIYARQADRTSGQRRVWRRERHETIAVDLAAGMARDVLEAVEKALSGEALHVRVGFGSGELSPVGNRREVDADE